MKAIIIEEARFAEFIDLLELQAHEIGENNEQPDIWDDDLWKTITNKVFRKMNYYFCQWAQYQGASVIHTYRGIK
jgi:hypothetical protein